jgi:hypothetical protein
VLASALSVGTHTGNGLVEIRVQNKKPLFTQTGILLYPSKLRFSFDVIVCSAEACIHNLKSLQMQTFVFAIKMNNV